MKKKGSRFLILTLIGTITYYAIGWLVFDFIIGDYTNLHTTQLAGFKKPSNEISLILLFLSCGAYAALVTLIIAFLSNIKNLLSSFQIGSAIGVLVAIMTDTYWYATSNFYLNTIVYLLDIIAAGITVGFMSFVIYYVDLKLPIISNND